MHTIPTTIKFCFGRSGDGVAGTGTEVGAGTGTLVATLVTTEA